MRERVCVRERERVCVCVRERECVCVREREKEREREGERERDLCHNVIMTENHICVSYCVSIRRLKLILKHLELF